jgi:hypothetical protein
LHQQRKASKSLGFWFFLHGTELIKHQGYCRWSAALGYSFIADIYGGNYPKTMQKLAKNLVTIKRTTRNIKTNFISIRSINSCGLILTILW